MSGKEARWLDTLSNFGIFPITLKPGKVHVLGDVLTKAPLVFSGNSSSLKVNDVAVFRAEFEDFIPNNGEDRLFRPIAKAMNGDWPEEKEKKLTIEKILPLF